MTMWLLLLVAVLVAPAPGLLPARISWPRLTHASPFGKGTRRRRAIETHSVAWVLALAGELRAGSPAAQAVRTCVARHGLAHHAARAAAMGGDVAGALRTDARASGAPLLASVAAFWDLAASSGAGMASALERAADGYRQGLVVRRTLDVELAAPRATARMMSLLPAVGLLLAVMVGAQPLPWLTGTLPGAACLLGGITANICGFLWIRRIVGRLEALL